MASARPTARFWLSFHFSKFVLNGGGGTDRLTAVGHDAVGQFRIECAALSASLLKTLPEDIQKGSVVDGQDTVGNGLTHVLIDGDDDSAAGDRHYMPVDPLSADTQLDASVFEKVGILGKCKQIADMAPVKWYSSAILQGYLPGTLPMSAHVGDESGKRDDISPNT